MLDLPARVQQTRRRGARGRRREHQVVGAVVVGVLAGARAEREDAALAARPVREADRSSEEDHPLVRGAHLSAHGRDAAVRGAPLWCPTGGEVLALVAMALVAMALVAIVGAWCHRGQIEREPRESVGRAQRALARGEACLLYTSPSPRDLSTSRMPSSA